ncbi:hypothetical protein [Rhodococcus sp. ARC_M6]|uniref:hypothetical protein n=1 Tax=Rhodococcus sp. ARC_M6 TaxID=2928852 RepID=UPI001FB3E4AE|nr:hypothetical protein [Rhodococcus sp. ARC_M6]MCJ0903510.1 hypothetical protein [Rhodococcus sp. ARC_M6]
MTNLISYEACAHAKFAVAAPVRPEAAAKAQHASRLRFLAAAPSVVRTHRGFSR